MLVIICRKSPFTYLFIDRYVCSYVQCTMYMQFTLYIAMVSSVLMPLKPIPCGADSAPGGCKTPALKRFNGLNGTYGTYTLKGIHMGS